MLGREPAAILAALQAILALAVGFGLNLTTEQMSLIMAASSAILGVIIRQSVVPSATVREAGSSPAALKAQAEVNRAEAAVEEAKKP